MGAVAAVLLIETAQLSVKNLGEKLPGLAPLMYLAAVAPAAAGALALGGWWRLRRRTARHPMPPEQA